VPAPSGALASTLEVTMPSPWNRALAVLVLVFFAALTPAFAAAPAPQDPAPAAAEPARPAPLPYLDELPPLLDRELFFGDPEISASQLSPDGRHLAFIKPYDGVRNVWVKGLDEPFDAARPLTADERPVPGYFWTEDGKYVLYVQDKGGNEDFHIYRVAPSAAAEEATGVPPAKDLTPLEGVRAFIYAVPEAAPGRILIGLNDRDPALHDVYRLDLETGERTLLIKNEQNVGGWMTDLEGNVRLAVRQRPDGGTEILTVEDGKLGPVVYACDFGESCGPIRFHRDGKRVYMVTNQGDDVDLARLVLFDPATREVELVESDPERDVDFGGAVFSDATEDLIATFYVGDRVRIYPKTDRLREALRFLRSALPEGEISFGELTNDDRYARVVVSSDVDPGTVYLFDWQEMKLETLYESRPELPTEDLAPMKAIRYASRDGVPIPAYLTTPKGVVAKDLAIVVLPHGGPWSRDLWGYDSIHQFLANRGYGVLSMNFRGSTGYGKAFLNAGDRTWGTGIMQHDITDGVKYLVDRGIADPKRVAIMGGSYGGYATLAGVTFTPDLYAAGVDIVGPSNLVSLLNSIPPYWGPFRRQWELRVGDPNDTADEERMKSQSPLFHAERIEAPLLVIQGANDPRVKKSEADQIVAKLHELGRDVEYVVAPDEGHGFRGRENRLAMFARTEAFLAEHLGGRYEEETAPDVAQRLAALTVDPATVEMPKAATGADLARTVPLPPVDPSQVAVGDFQYRSDLTLGGQQMTIESDRTVAREERGGEAVLVITSSAATPMGDTSDAYVLAAASLRPRSRTAHQGPATIEVTYGDAAVTGTIQAGAQQFPIEEELAAPVFGDDAALDMVVTALPLADGYEAMLRTFEVGMQNRTRLWSVAVADGETVEVPAGSFETFRVAIDPLDGEGGEQVLWVSREAPRVVVRSEGKLPPQMGGGTVVSELTGRGEAGGEAEPTGPEE
jgi:dipeptidyl aminopeptidase/acylaminoacyl peptidase